MNESADSTTLIRVDCRCRRHEVFSLRRRIVRENSGWLSQKLESVDGTQTPCLLLPSENRGYDCQILESILRAWKYGRYDPLHSKDMGVFLQLQHLARALWDYQCSPSPFESFAGRLRDLLWVEHYQEGIHLQAWTFIATVFGWQDKFEQAVLGIPQIGDDPSVSDMKLPFDQRVPRQIVTPPQYRLQCTTAFNYVHRRFCELLDPGGASKTVSKRLQQLFQDHDLRILLPEERNIHAIRDLGADGILRLFEDCLRDLVSCDESQGTTRNPRKPALARWLQSRKDKFKPTDRNVSQRSVAEKELEELHKFREEYFLSFGGLIGPQFDEVRSRHLILDEESRRAQAYMLASESAETNRQDLSEIASAVESVQPSAGVSGGNTPSTSILGSSVRPMSEISRASSV